MLIQTAVLLLLFMCCAVNQYAQSSSNVINVSFVINGKVVKSDKVRVEIMVGEKSLCPQITRGQFVVDVSDWRYDEKEGIRLRITYKQYVLDLNELAREHFQGAWKVKISKPNSRSEDVADLKNIDYVYSVEFYSGNGPGIVRSRVKLKES